MCADMCVIGREAWQRACVLGHFLGEVSSPRNIGEVSKFRVEVNKSFIIKLLCLRAAVC